MGRLCFAYLSQEPCCRSTRCLTIDTTFYQRDVAVWLWGGIGNTGESLALPFSKPSPQALPGIGFAAILPTAPGYHAASLHCTDSDTTKISSNQFKILMGEASSFRAQQGLFAVCHQFPMVPCCLG